MLIERRGKGNEAQNRGFNNGRGTRRVLADIMAEKGGILEVKPIGTIESIYRLCVGTPRQGLLAPHARGRILLDSADSVQGLEEFSHVWIVFIFHLNTTGASVKNKIAPPALGGKKVGLLATRSPHRFNPVGITLAKLRKVIVSGKNKVSLELEGLDLVDGTPVLDIKPFVGHYDAVSDSRVPEWVAGGLSTKRPVIWTSEAENQLRDLVPMLRFYDKFDDIHKCVNEVLAMDVRSAYQTQKARKGKSQAERASRVDTRNRESDDCTQQLDNLLIHFRVSNDDDMKRLSSIGSGAEDHVLVTAVEAL